MPDGRVARYTVETEEYDVSRRVRRTHTIYELQAANGVERVRRDWVIHWHTDEGFAQLCAGAGLDVVSLAADGARVSTARLRLAA